MNKSTSSKKTGHRGFTLIEVLVSLLVLSVGLLGLAALQTVSLQFNTDSYTRTQATLLAYDLVDRMRSNAAGVVAGNYDVPDPSAAATAKSGSANCDGSICSPSQMATYDLAQWYTRMETLLPESTSTKWALIERDAVTTSPTYNQVTITIRWTERDTDKQQRWVVQL